MLQSIFSERIIDALAGLAKRKYDRWSMQKDIRNKVHEVFSMEQPNILFLCNASPEFCEKLFQLASSCPRNGSECVI
jgi:hypothetical protein